MNEMLHLKKKIREEILCKRKQLSNKDVEMRSEKVCKNLFTLDEFKECNNALIFVSMPGEVETNELFRIGFDSGKVLAVPIVRKEKDALLLLAVLSESHIEELLSGVNVNCSKNWFRSKFGILEPRKKSFETISIQEIDLIVVPGLGFDRSGMRLGFGGGHYDRLLAKRKKPSSAIAVSFDFQIYPYIPHNAHDQRVDLIVTDNEVIKPNVTECKNNAEMSLPS